LTKDKAKATIGQLSIMIDLIGRGYDALIPATDDCVYDLVFSRSRNKLIEAVQVKAITSTDNHLKVRFYSRNSKSSFKQYMPDEVDWRAVYDLNSKKIYYLKLIDFYPVSTFPYTFTAAQGLQCLPTTTSIFNY
jgi:hypothetical protein